jgi:curved DNA-binding protein CbpA
MLRGTRVLRNAFNVLGVSPESTLPEIKAAYRLLAQEV